MFISADKTVPNLNSDGTRIEMKLDPAKSYRAPLVIHAKKKATLKTFFDHYKRSTCSGQGVAVKVFYGRYRQQRGNSAQSAVKSDTDWLKDVMAAKHGLPGVSEVIQEMMTSRKKFVLISNRAHVQDPKLFRHQLEVVRLHETTYPETTISFLTISNLLRGESAEGRSALEWRQKLGLAPDPTMSSYEDQLEKAFSMSAIDLDH
jgi:hypothetical protein